MKKKQVCRAKKSQNYQSKFNINLVRTILQRVFFKSAIKVWHAPKISTDFDDHISIKRDVMFCDIFVAPKMYCWAIK